jgi:hypothetical protein
MDANALRRRTFIAVPVVAAASARLVTQASVAEASITPSRLAHARNPHEAGTQFFDLLSRNAPSGTPGSAVLEVVSGITFYLEYDQPDSLVGGLVSPQVLVRQSTRAGQAFQSGKGPTWTVPLGRSLLVPGTSPQVAVSFMGFDATSHQATVVVMTPATAGY